MKRAILNTSTSTAWTTAVNGTGTTAHASGCRRTSLPVGPTVGGAARRGRTSVGEGREGCVTLGGRASGATWEDRQDGENGEGGTEEWSV